MSNFEKKKALICWGSSGAYGTDTMGQPTIYREALELIVEAGSGYGVDVHMVPYPGHPAPNAVPMGLLSFGSALKVTLDCCRTIQPAWMIGRSFGALVVAAAMADKQSWVNKCKGGVLWGPGFRRFNEKTWPTLESKRVAVERYKEFKTDLASDFFDSLPDIESLVPFASCNLKFARGQLDPYNTTNDLINLATIHEDMQPRYRRSVVEIDGLDHTPTLSKKISREQVGEYFRCLFEEVF